MKPVAAALVLFSMEAVTAVSAMAGPAPVIARIDATRRSAPATPYEYGMFIEPIGDLVARTLWAEMLDDRKFYYPVGPASADVPPPLNAEGRPGVSYRKWRPIGGDNAVTMDQRAAFVGAQSASVALAADQPRGLGQSGITVARGRRYVGNIWLNGDAGAAVSVTLVGRSPAGPPGRSTACAHLRMAQCGLCLYAHGERGRRAAGNHGYRERAVPRRHRIADAGR